MFTQKRLRSKNHLMEEYVFLNFKNREEDIHQCQLLPPVQCRTDDVIHTVKLSDRHTVVLCDRYDENKKEL